MSITDEVVLLDFWPSLFGMRVRIALDEKGIKYDYKEESLLNKSSLLLEMNPVHKTVPVLIHNGKPICESLIILEYIDEVWKHKYPLLPRDPYEKANARFWADYIDKNVYVFGKKIWMTKGDEQEKYKKDLIETFKVLEGQLGEKPYFGGEKMGFLDVALIPYYSWFYSYDICGNFSIEVFCPKLLAWAKKCMQKESVSKSLPDQERIYGFVLRLKKFYGVD
ncbi:hypothetical protein MKW92_041228 [Papaver armeniacum]|nr:hypothetical protein MKW92_041228 [Papaver armeniacum]